MKALKYFYTFLLFTLGIGIISSCKNNEKEENILTVEPGIYSADIILSAENGTKDEYESRGINEDGTQFTAEYTYDNIYLHIVENKEDGSSIETKKAIEIELCTDCDASNKCFNITAEQSQIGGPVTIKVGNEEITLNDNEDIYFSTEESSTWTATPDNTSTDLPAGLKGATIFQQGDNTQKEILRSGTPYSGETFLRMIANIEAGQSQTLTLERHVSGFKVHVLFTDNSDNNHDITEEEWKGILGCSPTDLNIKIYFGPNMCETYDILNNESNGSGYYASNNQKYLNFNEVTVEDYQGWGYETGSTLLSPVNIRENGTFQIYICIEYGGHQYYTAFDTRTLPQINVVNEYIYAFDVQDLADIVKGTVGVENTDLKSRASSSFQKIDIKPIKVICN